MPEAAFHNMALMTQQDLVHEHLQYYLKIHPDAECKIQRKAGGQYVIHGRDVKLGFSAQNFLVVQDGPLRQPFVDYMDGKEASAVYHKAGLSESCLNQVPKDARMSFVDDGFTCFSRVESMAIAKEQAICREKAANYVQQGKTVPSSLMSDYEKTIDLKLGRHSRKSCESHQEPVAPAWWPGVQKQREARSTSPIRKHTVAPTNRLTSSRDGTESAPHPRQEKKLPAHDGVASVPYPFQLKTLVHHFDGSETVPYPRQQQKLAVSAPLVPGLSTIYCTVPGAMSPRPPMPNLPLAPLALRHLLPRASSPLRPRAPSPSVHSVAVVAPMARKMVTPRVHQMLRPAVRLGGA